LLLSIPSSKRIGRGLERDLVVQLYPHLAALPEGSDGLPISNKVFWRLLRSFLLRAGKPLLTRIPQFIDFQGAYHFFEDWWQDPEISPLLKGVIEKASFVEAGILKSPAQLGALYRQAGEWEPHLMLFSLYTLASVIDSWHLEA
jgi:hypothetical protein